MKEASLSDLYDELWLRLRNEGKILWTQKDGTKVPINEMDIKHLINCINMLEKKNEKDAKLEALKEEYYEGLAGDFEG